MPRITEYREQVPTPTGQGAMISRANAPEGMGHLGALYSSGMRSLASGLEEIGKTIHLRDEEEARAWSASTLSKTRLEWTKNLLDRQAKAQPGAPEFTPTLLNDYDEYVNKTLETAPTPAAKKYLGERLQAIRTQLGENALTFQASAQIDWRNDQFTAAISDTQKLMNTDPSQYPVAMAERLAEIDGANLPPVKKSALREKAINDISAAAVWAQIQKSPTQFLQSIGFLDGVDPKTGKVRKSSGDLNGTTGNTAFDMLGFDKRAQLFTQAIQLKSQVDADVERGAQVQRKKLSEDAMKNAWMLVLGDPGNINTREAYTYLEQIRPVIESSQYHSLLVAIDNKSKPDKEPKTDPGSFRELQRLINDNRMEDAQAFAFKAHKSGLISDENLSSALSRIHTVSRQGGPDTEYEITLRNITRALEPGAMVPDPVGRSRQADAIATFDRWVKENKPNDEQIRKRGGEIRQQYQFLNLQDTVLALPMPRSGVIRRTPADAPGMTQDIFKAGQKAQAEFAAKKLTRKEYEEEIEILDRWRRVIGTNQK